MVVEYTQASVCLSMCSPPEINLENCHELQSDSLKRAPLNSCIINLFLIMGFSDLHGILLFFKENTEDSPFD